MYRFEQLAANATLRWLNHLAKQKLLSFFIQQKITKRWPWKTEFLAYVISREWSANQQKQLQNDAFHVKTSQSAKNQLDPEKMKISPKSDIRPFCTKLFNCKRSPSLICTGHCWSLFLLNFYWHILIYLCQNGHFFEKKSYTPAKTGVILHPYLPILATSLQQPLFSVPKVAIVERFDCNYNNPQLQQFSIILIVVKPKPNQ